MTHLKHFYLWLFNLPIYGRSKEGDGKIYRRFIRSREVQIKGIYGWLPVTHDEWHRFYPCDENWVVTLPDRRKFSRTVKERDEMGEEEWENKINAERRFSLELMISEKHRKPNV